MNKLVKINGLKEVEGMKFHDIEGGFGEGKKAMLVKEIANIHGRDTGKVNELINKNIIRFKNGIDILDLKGSNFDILLKDNGIYTQNALNRSENIYLLSERGYAKLLKILEDDVAWEQYEKLVDGYFNLRGQARPTCIEDVLIQSLQEMKEVKQTALEAKEEVQDVRNDFEDFKKDLPLIGEEPEELQEVVRRTGTKALGGKNSPAYEDKKLRARVFQSVWRYVKDQFNVKKYKAIKRKYLNKAIELAESYKAPFHLQEEIDIINNQSKLEI